MKKLLLWCLCWLGFLGTAQGFAQTVNLELPSTGFVGEPVQATVRFVVIPAFSDIAPPSGYFIEWGDDTREVVTPTGAVGNEKVLNHSYSDPAVYTANFCAEYTGRRLPICSRAVINIAYKNPTLEAPTTTAPFTNTTIQLRDLYALLEYRLDWGDGTVESISNKTSDTPTHQYTKTGAYTIRLTAPQVSSLTPAIAVIQVRYTNPSLTVSPSRIAPNGSIEALLQGLFANLEYKLEWGDGDVETITGVTSATRRHTYNTARTQPYTIKLSSTDGIVPQLATVLVIDDSCQMDFNPSNPSPNQTLQLRLSNLGKTRDYTVRWGDGTSQDFSSNSQGQATLSYQYPSSRVYFVQVLAQGNNIPLCARNIVVGNPQLATPVLSFTPSSPLPDDTVTVTMTLLSEGLTYRFDWGDGAAPVVFVADNKTETLSRTFALEKTYTAKLITPQTTVTGSFTVDLPAPTEQIEVSDTARAGQQVEVGLTQLLKNRPYELEMPDGKKVAVPASSTGSASVRHTFAKEGKQRIKLSLVSAQNRRFLRRTQQVELLEASNLKISRIFLQFRRSGLGGAPTTSTPLGTNKLSPLDLVIQYTGFGELEGEVVTTAPDKSLITKPLSLKLEKTGGQLVNGVRQIIAPLDSQPNNQLGTYTVSFAIPKQISSEPVSYFVHPTAFYMAGLRFVVKTGSGSLSEFSGSADFALVIDGKDYPDLPVSFSKLETMPRATDPAVPASPSEVNIKTGSVDGNLQQPLEIQTADRIGLKIRSLRVDAVSGATLDGTVVVPYDTCRIAPEVDTRPTPPPNQLPVDIFENIPRGGTPFPNELVNPVFNSPTQLNSAIQAGAAQIGAYGLSALGQQGALNFGVDVPQSGLRGSRPASSGSKVVRTQLRVASPATTSAVQLAQSGTIYEIVAGFSQAKLTGEAGNLYLENLSGKIEGRLASGAPTIKVGNNKVTTTSAPIYNSNNSLFAIGCSGVMFANDPTLTVDLSQTQSPPTSDLQDTYAGTTQSIDTTQKWRGVLFPKASNSLRFVAGTTGYQKAQSQGLQVNATMPANVSYDSGYNWAVTTLQAGSGLVNAWKFDINKFGMAMFRSRIVSGGGNGTFYLPFFEQYPNGRFFILEVRYNVTPTWEIVTDDFIQHDFGASSVVGGCGVFVRTGEGYPIQFAKAFWAVKRLIKSGPINKAGGGQSQFKVLSSAPLPDRDQATQFLSAGLGGSQPSQQGVSSNHMGDFYDSALQQGGEIDKVSRCNENTPLVGNTISDAGLRIPLPNLRVYPDSKVDLGGQTWYSISGTDDLEMAGMKFPADQVGVGRDASGMQYLALASNRYTPVESLPAVRAEMRYPVEKGRDLGKVTLSGFTAKDNGTNSKMNFKNTFEERTIDLSGKLYNLSRAPSQVLQSYSISLEKSGMGYMAPSLDDFEFPRDFVNQKPSKDNTIKVDSLSVTAKMVFGRKNKKFYFSVYAGVEQSHAPIVTVLGVLNFYGFYGGVNYGLRWDPGATITDLKTDFDRNKLTDDPGKLQIMVGTIMAIEKGNMMHTVGALFLDSTATVTLNITGWLITPMNEGYFAKTNKKAPQLKGLITVGGNGFLAQFCIGNRPPPGSSMNCNGIAPLKAVGAEVTGWAEMKVGQGQYYLYIGDYKNRAEAKFFDLFKATGYFIAGQTSATYANPPNVQVGAIGFWMGGDVRARIRVGDSGNVDFGITDCDWSWYAEASYYAFVDFGLQLDPRVELNAAFRVEIFFAVGARACGIGIDISLKFWYGGSIKANSDGAKITGYVGVEIKMPSIIPDIKVEVYAEVNL